jgi:hypothetical protein
MKGRLLAVASLSIGLAAVGCGGGGGKVSATSLEPRLLPASSVPGFGLQRSLDWDDPVNLVGEGLALPQITHPSAAVEEFRQAHLRGAAGEVLSNGAASNATEVRVGVAEFNSATDANRVRDWMHTEDLREPCFGQCIYTTRPVALPGIPSARFVVQSTHLPPPRRIPPGAPKFTGGPANYLAEFTIGSYLYWAILQADAGAKANFERGLQRYYLHAKRAA